MAVYPKKLEDGRWQHDFFVDGRGSPRKRRILETKKEALRFEREEKNKYANGSFERKSAQDNRRLKALVDEWYRLHGNQLRYNEGTRRKLDAFADRLKNPIARKLKAKHFTNDRAERIESGIKPTSVNNDIAYLRAMFNELIRLGDWKYENPLNSIRKLKVDDIELTYLDLDDIDFLFYDIETHGRNPDTLLVTKLCLATGARWSEAETIKPEQLFNNRVTFIASNTKGRKHRTVPIPPELAEELKNRAKSTRNGQRMFQYCYSAFRKSVERCKIELPPGQMAHVLRHTFASHFIMNYGNILSLQKILGHVDIKTTMRYAHLAPDYLDEALQKNPLSLLDASKRKKNRANKPKDEK